jgi:hypothetical protein
MRIYETREQALRQHILAKRMILVNARTRTVTVWTGLLAHRVRTLTELHLPPAETRHRGNPPASMASLVGQVDVESESSVFLYLALQLEVIPPGRVRQAHRTLPSVTRGERLMSAYELYRTVIDDPHLSIDHASLLLLEYAEGRQLQLTQCVVCQDIMVNQPCERREQCPFCRDHSPLKAPNLRHSSGRPLLRAQPIHELVEQYPSDGRPQRQNEHEAERKVTGVHQEAIEGAR